MSLRLRLAAWYTALLVAVLAITIGLFYAWHARSHDQDLETALHGAVEHASGDIAEAIDRGRPLTSLQLAPPAMIDAPLAIWVFDRRDGRLLATGGPAGEGVFTALLPDKAAEGYTTSWTDQGRAELYTVLLPPPGDVRIVSAVSLAPLDESLASLRQDLATLTAIVMGLAIASGWIISGRALAPVATLDATAAAIARSRDFSRRVPPTRHEDEIGRLTTTLNDMLASLDDAYRAQQRFVGEVSHELRTPLTTIRANVELLAAGGVGAREAARHIDRETARLARLVDELLILARADAGPVPFAGQPLALDELVMEVFDELRPVMRERLRVTSIEHVVVDGEADRLKQLLVILVDNAFRYSGPDGRIDLWLERRGPDAFIHVDDQGIGLPSEGVDRLFQRFYRAPAARRAHPGGSGLGLAIAQWIVARHGGSVSLAPNEPRGTRALVRLPAREAPGEARAA